MMTLEVDAVATRRHPPELILPIEERHGIKRVRGIIGGHQRTGSEWQYFTLYLGHHHIVEDREMLVQQKFAIQEKDAPAKVEVQPKPEFVVGDIGYVGPADIDRKKW